MLLTLTRAVGWLLSAGYSCVTAWFLIVTFSPPRPDAPYLFCGNVLFETPVWLLSIIAPLTLLMIAGMAFVIRRFGRWRTADSIIAAIMIAPSVTLAGYLHWLGMKMEMSLLDGVWWLTWTS
jgi:hypothetical protein